MVVMNQLLPCFETYKNEMLKHIQYTLRSVNDVTEGIAQESPMGDSWVIPRKVDKMVLPTTRQGRALLIGRRKRWVIPTTILGRAVLGITQESPIVFFSQSVVSSSRYY